MARKARVKYEQGTYLVSQNGHEAHPIFRDIHDREKFLSIIEKNRQKFKFNLLAYCVGNKNHYDLVIDVNGSDLSKVMKSINIAYAMYRKAEVRVFKDRYKSKFLTSSLEIDQVLSEIEARKACSIDLVPDSDAWQACYDARFIEDAKDQRFEDCEFCINELSKAKEKLENLAKEEAVSLEFYLKDKERRNDLIKSFRKYSTLSLKEIGHLFGDLSESSICKIINE